MKIVANFIFQFSSILIFYFFYDYINYIISILSINIPFFKESIYSLCIATIYSLIESVYNRLSTQFSKIKINVEFEQKGCKIKELKFKHNSEEYDEEEISLILTITPSKNIFNHIAENQKLAISFFFNPKYINVYSKTNWPNNRFDNCIIKDDDVHFFVYEGFETSGEKFIVKPFELRSTLLLKPAFPNKDLKVDLDYKLELESKICLKRFILRRLITIECSDLTLKTESWN